MTAPVHAPGRLVLVAGTATEVGKTWVGCRLAERLRARGLRVAARKPVQSFSPGEPTDADLLARATGESPHEVCPPAGWFEVPMAPFMAADLLGRPPVVLDDLVGAITWPPGIDVGLVEPAGGVRSPITHDDADTVDLARRLAPDRVVLVADAGLGVLNATRLCLDALAGMDTVVFLNRFDPGSELHRQNRAWLDTRVAAAVVTAPAALADLVVGT